MAHNDVLGMLRRASGAPLDNAVLSSRDWRMRVLDAAGANRVPATWRDGSFLRNRHSALVSVDRIAVHDWIDADVAYLNDTAELA